MGHPQRVLIVGGGIAGLATARALHRRGIEPEVVERAAAWSHPGGGGVPACQLGPGVGRARAPGGVAQACLRDQPAAVPGSPRPRACRGEPARRLGAIGPCAAISHHGLHELLREGVPLRLGRTVTALDEQGPLVRAVFDDGSASDYDLVVGADGVRSWVRSVAFAGAAPKSKGMASWRFLVDGVAEDSAWTVRLGRGTAFLTIPLHGGRSYCYADVNIPAATDPTGGDPATLAQLFGAFAEPVPTILGKYLAGGGRPYFSPIEEVVQERWVRGRVVLAVTPPT